MSKIKQLLFAALIAGASCVGGPAMALDDTFFAILNGGNEVSDSGQANAGDPNGYGSASVVFVGPNRFCYSIIVNNIGDPTAAHIHRGRAGVNGQIVVTLNAPNVGNPGLSRGCETVGDALAEAIRNHPQRFYVNVHTGAFPGGAVRGQLF
jgi:hypothetical protein